MGERERDALSSAEFISELGVKVPCTMCWYQISSRWGHGLALTRNFM